MLANTYNVLNKDIYSKDEVVIEKLPDSPDSDYTDIAAKDFIEPAGMHYFSINKDKYLLAPFFKSNISPINMPSSLLPYTILPTYAYKYNIPVMPKLTYEYAPLFSDMPKYISVNLADRAKLDQYKEFYNFSQVDWSENRFQYYKKELLADNFSETDLKLLENKFCDTFKKDNLKAGLLKITPHKRDGYKYEAITPLRAMVLANQIINISGYLLVKIIAKIPKTQTLRYSATIIDQYNSATDYPTYGDTMIGFCRKQYRGQGTDSTSFGLQLTDSLYGTGDWEEYNFIISAESKRIILSRLCFYVDYDGKPEPWYLAYMDCMILPNKYRQLWSYTPFENITAVKYGCLFDRNFIEASQLTDDINTDHMLIIKKKPIPTRSTRKSRRK